jgi:hypothetical protein
MKTNIFRPKRNKRHFQCPAASFFEPTDNIDEGGEMITFSIMNLNCLGEFPLIK